MLFPIKLQGKTFISFSHPPFTQHVCMEIERRESREFEAGAQMK